MAISKSVLKQYCDLQKERDIVRERISRLEADLLRIKEEGIVVDKVRGGEGGLRTYRIEGFPDAEYNRKRTLLYKRKAMLAELEMRIEDSLADVEEYICGISDSRVRLIASLRYRDGLSWEDVARRVGGGNTEDSVRKAFTRFFEKNL